MNHVVYFLASRPPLLLRMPQRPAGTVTCTVVRSGQWPAGRKTSVVGETAFQEPRTLGVSLGWAVRAASAVEKRTTSLLAYDTFCAPECGATAATLTATTGVGLGGEACSRAMR